MRKSTEILLNKVNKFINTIDDFEDVVLHNEFECLPTTNEIKIDVHCKPYEYSMFLTTLYMRKNVPCDISLFTWALLHEVGHCMTENLLDVRANNHCQYVKHKIEKGKIPTYEYYFLADEKRATNWAIRFVRNNYDEVKKFDNDIRGYLYANL